MTGTVNIARSLFDHEFFAAETMTEREAWIWLIMAASWKARTTRAGDYVVNLDRGQLAASIRFMAKAWGWTPARVQRYLKRLILLEMICSKIDTGVTVITICNYSEYQTGAEAGDTGPIQDRYKREEGCKKDVRRIEEEREDTDAYASDGFAVADDFAKALFDRGVSYLIRHGVREAHARSVIGKFRKDHPDSEIFEAFKVCSQQGVVDPIPWIIARLKPPDRIDVAAIMATLNPDGTYKDAN